MKVVKVSNSVDGITKKYLLQVREATGTQPAVLVETVYVNLPTKHVICFSCQDGCNSSCQMCALGRSSKKAKQLTPAEMYDQCKTVYDLEVRDEKPVLYSMMRQGEPLEHPTYTAGVLVMLAFGTRPQDRFTISTTGVDVGSVMGMITQLEGWRAFEGRFKLQISLHSSNEEIRQQLMPGSLSLACVMREARLYASWFGPDYALEYAYVLIKGVNDQIKHAEELSKLLPRGSHVKLSRLNPIDGCDLQPSDETTIKMFTDILKVNGMVVEYYITDGADIAAACGQITK